MSNWEIIPDNESAPTGGNWEIIPDEGSPPMSGGTAAMTGFGHEVMPFLNPVSKLLGSMGLQDPAMNMYQQAIEQGYPQAQEQHPWTTGAGQLAGNLMMAGPAYKAAAPLGKAGTRLINPKNRFTNYLSKILEGGLQGSAAEGAISVAKEENPLHAMGIGGTIGALIPGIGIPARATAGGVKSLVDSGMGTAKRLLGNEQIVAKDILQGMLPGQVEGALKVHEAGKKIGQQLSPSESSGNPIVAANESRLVGRTEEGAKALLRHDIGKKESQGKAVKQLLDAISPSEGPAQEALRESSKKIIKKQAAERQAQASPFYEQANPQIVPANKLNHILKDSNVAKSWDSVHKDPTYASKLETIKPNSIEALQLVKENMDDRISGFLRGGENKKASLVIEARNRLVNAMDAISPEYKKARSIYQDESTVLDSLKESAIGKISELPDMQVKNVSKIIFDPQQTDPTKLRALRDAFQKENPSAWSNIIRNEMERLIKSDKNLGKTGKIGGAFYDKVLNDQTKFQQFHDALKGNAPAQERLKMMKDAFKNLNSAVTAKTARGQESTSMSMARSTPQFWLKLAQKHFGKKYDKAAVDIITSDKWTQHLRDIHHTKDEASKIEKLAKLFERAAKSNETKAAVSQSFRIGKKEE